MKVLITGGAGFIGSNIADSLVELGFDVVIVDDLSNGKENNINKNASFFKFDIRDSNLSDIFKKEKPEIVIHNAAQLSVRISVENPVFDSEVNVVGGLNVFNCCARAGVKRVIFASSGGTVYGEQKEFPADEDHSTDPVSPYGVAKLASEKYLGYYHSQYGLEYTALRYANIYGPRQDPLGEAGVVAIFSSKILRGEEPVINGDGSQTRDYVYVGDAVNANILAIKSDFTGCLNIGTGIETDVNKIFLRLREASGNDSIREIHGPAKSGEQYRSVLDYSLAKRILGWEPKTDVNTGLVKTFEWFSQNF